MPKQQHQSARCKIWCTSLDSVESHWRRALSRGSSGQGSPGWGMQTALKILSERPELAIEASPARQTSSGVAELAERTASEAAEHSTPQSECSRRARQVSGGAADQAQQAPSGAAQPAGHIHPGPVVSRGVAGSRLAKETSAAEAMAVEAAMHAEMDAAEDVVDAPSSASAVAAPQADEEAAEAVESAGLPREGVVPEQAIEPARQAPTLEAAQPERTLSQVSATPSPATEIYSAADPAQRSQFVELASAEETAYSAYEKQPAQPDKMGLPKTDDLAQLREPSSVARGSPGIAGDASRKRERSVRLEQLEEQEKPLRGAPAQQGSILGAGQPGKGPEPSDELQEPLTGPPEVQGAAAGAGLQVWQPIHDQKRLEEQQLARSGPPAQQSSAGELGQVGLPSVDEAPAAETGSDVPSRHARDAAAGVPRDGQCRSMCILTRAFLL